MAIKLNADARKRQPQITRMTLINMTDPPSVGVFTTDVNYSSMGCHAGAAHRNQRGICFGSDADCAAARSRERGLLKRFQRSLNEGVVEMLAPAFHHYLIPCAPITCQNTSTRCSSGHNRALRDDRSIAGLIVTVEDVTERLERERNYRCRCWRR